MTVGRNGRVRVHWNLHRGGYSVTVKGRVTAKVGRVCLRDVRFVVSDALLAYMRGLGKRKVVAWCEGVPCEDCTAHASSGAPVVTFNPWKGDRFTDRATGAVVEAADHVHLETGTRSDGTPGPIATVVG